MREDSELEEKKTYHDNGMLRLQTFYKSGKREGEYKTWYDNGQLSECLFYRDGELEGEYKTWNFNGQARSRGFYRDGKPEGKNIFWHDNGIPDELGVYKNGILTGEQRIFDLNGTIVIHRYFRGWSFEENFTLKSKRIFTNLKRLLYFRLQSPDINCFMIPDMIGIVFTR